MQREGLWIEPRPKPDSCSPGDIFSLQNSIFRPLGPPSHCVYHLLTLFIPDRLSDNSTQPGFIYIYIFNYSVFSGWRNLESHHHWMALQKSLTCLETRIELDKSVSNIKTKASYCCMTNGNWQTAKPATCRRNHNDGRAPGAKASHAWQSRDVSLQT